MVGMARDPLAPPPEFVSYVESRLPSLIKSARRYVPDERMADQLARDLLSGVAVRWPWYARGVPMMGKLFRRDPDPIAAADRFLVRAFREGVKDYGEPQSVQPLHLDPQAQLPEAPPPRTFLRGRLSVTEEAQLLWERSAQILRRRSLIVGGLVVMGALVFISRPRPEPQTTPVEQPPSPEPSVTAVPHGMGILPSLAEQARLTLRKSPIPAYLDFSTAITPMPKGRRALGIFSPAEQSSVVLLDDGKIYLMPQIEVRIDTPAALSPDGRWVAYRLSDKIALYDITTQSSRTLDINANLATPIWLDSTHIMVSVNNGGQILTTAGAMQQVLPVDIAETLVPQGYPALSGDPVLRATELLSLGRPATAPARVHTRKDDKDDGVDVIVQGDLASWLGLWRGVGFGVRTGNDPADRGLLVRRCQTAGRIPVQYGDPQGAIFAIKAVDGKIQQVLLNSDSTGADRVEPLGWLDRQTVLVTSNSDAASVIVSWHIPDGTLELITVTSTSVRIALADLTVRAAA
jgi:hypothetical protein